MSKQVSIKLYVEQVRHGHEYKGYIEIAQIRFDYELRFAVPIDELDDMKPSDNLEEARRVFQISIMRNGANIELSGDEYGFFFQLIVFLALDFYNDPRTQSNNEGFLELIIRDRGLLSSFINLSLGMMSFNTYELSPELCEMLNDPKFGCALAID